MSPQIGNSETRPDAAGSRPRPQRPIAADAPELRAPVDAAIRQQLVEHLPVLRAFAISLTRNGSRADDLVQETLVKAWANIHSFEPGTNMRAWLFTILRNSFYSERRKARREVADVEGELTARIACKPDHDGRLQLRDFRAAFMQLPARQREALVLVGVLQHSYEDAARMCDVRVGTIKSRLNRGRAQLALMLGISATEAMELTDGATSAVIAANGTTAL